jgi:hypothetical protein
MLVVAFVCSVLAAGAQNAIPQQLRAQMTMDRITDGDRIGQSDLLYGIPPAPGRTLGDYYLDPKWNTGSVFLKDSERKIEGLPLKYDIKTQTIEILANKAVKVLDARKVKGMVWYDSLTQLGSFFANAGEFTEEGVPLAGLIEVMSDGAIPLLCYTTVWIKKADYVPALDVGSRDDKIMKRKTYYYSIDRQLTKISSKKKLLPVFGDKADAVDAFIKTNDLSVNKPFDLKLIFDFFNTQPSK